MISFINLFFNSALLSCAINRLQQQDFSLGQGLGLSFKRIGKIFLWSLINSTIGLVLNLLQRSHSLVQRLLILILGCSWNVVSYFVLPLIIIDNLEPWSALKRSYQLFKGSWRKMFSVFTLLFILIIPALAALFGLGYLLINSAMPYLILLVLALFICGILFASVLETIVNAALYVEYFKHAEVVGFDKTMLEKIMNQA